MFGPFDGQRLRQRDHAGTRGCRVRHAGQAAVHGSGDGDDAAVALALPDPALRRALHHVPGAVQVGVDDGVPALVGEVHRVRGELPAGIVHQHVDAAEAFPDGVEQAFDLRRIADRHRVHEDLAARQGAQLLGTVLQRIELAAADRQRGTQACEQEGDRLADAAAGAGHQHDLAGEQVVAVDRGQLRQGLVARAEFRLLDGRGHAVCSCVK